MIKEKNPYFRYAQYIIPKTVPLKYPIRLHCYTRNSIDLDNFYLELNHRDKHTKEELEKLVREGKLIKLPKAVRLPELESLFLTSDNKIIRALSYAPERRQKLIHAL